jgi:predicted phosphodiesterase
MIRGFLSDVHGNVEALLEALKVLRAHGASEIYFLGDCVGYLPGVAALSALVHSDVKCIRGNHEAMLLAGNVDAEREKLYRFDDTRAEMTPAQREAIARWPASRTIPTRSGPLLLVHGSPRDPTFEYVQPDSSLDAFQLERGTTVFMGHTHRAFIRSHGEVRYVNVGSCAMPRDIAGIGTVAVHDDDRGEVRLLRFDIRPLIEAAIARCEGVHPSVLAALLRQADAAPAGDFVGK